jgi:hypothetical protein
VQVISELPGFSLTLSSGSLLQSVRPLASRESVPFGEKLSEAVVEAI